MRETAGIAGTGEMDLRMAQSHRLRLQIKAFDPQPSSEWRNSGPALSNSRRCGRSATSRGFIARSILLHILTGAAAIEQMKRGRC